MTAAQSWRDRPVSAGIGVVLRAARTDRGQSLADASERTRIRVEHLAALEEERFEALPPHPFVWGFLRTYAIELGLDPEPLLQRLAIITAPPGGTPVKGARRLDAALIPARPLTPAQRIARSAGIIGLVAGILLAGYFVKQLQEFSQPVPVPTPRAAAPTQEPPATQDAAPGVAPAAEATPEPAAAPTVAPAEVMGSGVAVEVEATGRSWILVVADEAVIYEGFVVAGDRRHWQGSGAITIRVGNAGAVLLMVNGRNVGPMGGPGEVVSRTFRKEDVR